MDIIIIIIIIIIVFIIVTISMRRLTCAHACFCPTPFLARQDRTMSAPLFVLAPTTQIMLK